MGTNTDIRDLVPADAWDTHIHVFDPAKFPYSPARSYTPAAAALSAYPYDSTRCTNIVIVQATVQGTDAAPLVDALQQTPPAFANKLRGLAVLDLEQTSDDELRRLHTAGVRGVRMHEVSWGFGDQESEATIARKLEKAAARLNPLGWVIDLYMHPAAWMALAPTVSALPPGTKVIADHWAGFKPGDGKSAEFAALVQLVSNRSIYVKLSAFERQYHGHPEGIASLEPMAQALIEAGPGRLIFASDWPNTALASSRASKTKEERLDDIEGFRDVDHALHIKALRGWIKDEETWRRFWVETPASLFGGV